MSMIPSFTRRTKTFSESSDTGSTSANEEILTLGTSAPTGSSSSTGNYLYDIDGKFAYSYYEKKPELYDVDGKHRYKYFNYMKHYNKTNTPNSTPTAPKSFTFANPSTPQNTPTQTQNFLYDLDGKVEYQVWGQTPPGGQNKK